MFTNQKKILLVRHGVPTDYGRDPGLKTDMLHLLDRSADNIAWTLTDEQVGRVALLSSRARRTRETAQYIGEKLSSEFDVSDVVETSLLTLGAALSEVESHRWRPACLELSKLMDTIADENSAVVAVTHQPVIERVAYVADAEADTFYGGVTVLR